MTEQDYKRAYERQKLAREKAESLLEVRSRELYEANETLQNAYNTLSDQKNQLVQQEKLASIGLLAAGVAHEINNPVGFVKSNLQTLENYTASYSAVLNAYRNLAEAAEQGVSITEHIDKLKDILKATDLEHIAQDGVDCIKESLSGVERIEEIIVNLSDFSRSESDDNRVLCDINNLLDNTLKLVWNEIKYNCEIEKDYAELPKIYGRPGQLRQVFVNIIVNAAQAIESKGALKIVTRTGNDKVIIEFIDNGPGLDEETSAKLFDPFYTTKEVGSGTGLGLSVSHGIVANHHGSLTAKNNEGKGACFTVSLPFEMRKNR
jgi:two-component system, NtrC family, sensor kinase